MVALEGETARFLARGVTRIRALEKIGITRARKQRKILSQAQLMGICGFSSLCILLLIIAQQRIRITPVPYYNRTAKSIPEILDAERMKIVNEMEYFGYNALHRKVKNLYDLTPETGGNPVLSVVVTKWRSGSSLLSGLLDVMPSNFYHHEPLFHFGMKRVRDAAETKKATDHLKKLFTCNYTEMDDYLELAKNQTLFFKHNQRLWDVCKEHRNVCCYGSKFLTPFCSLFPLQSMKTVRLRLRSVESFLEDPKLNVRIILLVRDPRFTMQDRRICNWCKGNSDCDDPSILCKDLLEDYYTAVRLSKKYPSQFRTLRYEDLSMDLYRMTQEILEFYGLPFNFMAKEFAKKRTRSKMNWKLDLNIDEIKLIERKCEKAMELWNYNKIENFTGRYQYIFNPIMLPSPFTYHPKFIRKIKN